MSKKTIEISDNAAIRIEAVEINDQQRISLRQLYKKKTDTEWQFGRQGLTIPVKNAEALAKWISKYATDPNTEFKKLEK